jgi:ketosteroid isomerase-like protein
MRAAADDKRIKATQDYFRLADQGRPEVLDLFHEDAEIYFPKFGFGFGRQSLLEMTKGFAGTLEFIQHDYDAMTFIAASHFVVVEGTSHGRMAGKAWTGGVTPGGRFCNVFKFRGGRISSLHVYLDPDYTGEDLPRFRWGMIRKW